MGRLVPQPPRHPDPYERLLVAKRFESEERVAVYACIIIAVGFAVVLAALFFAVIFPIL